MTIASAQFLWDVARERVQGYERLYLTNRQRGPLQPSSAQRRSFCDQTHAA